MIETSEISSLFKNLQRTCEQVNDASLTRTQIFHFGIVLKGFILSSVYVFLFFPYFLYLLFL